MRKHAIYLLLLVPLLAFLSCQPERSYIEDSGARLEFTVDTLMFDTVFTTVGTVTRSFRIHNPHRQFIRIDEITLAGGAASVFRVNVDGEPGVHFSDLEIAPLDSMYIFVEATLDPNNSPDILRIQDSLVFLTNGEIQDVDLMAWGQDVHMIHGGEIFEPAVWQADKPYLVIDYLYVDTLASLTMEEGVEVYLHKNAVIYVDGSLKVQGSMENPIWFRGDRLEEFYQDVPGQWGMIYLSGNSHDNEINHAQIHNGTMGILISASPESGLRPDLALHNTVINRMSSNGIYALNAGITASNLVVGDCGGSCLALQYEGDYQFNHCTFANYWPTGYSNRQLPALVLTDYFVTYDEQGNLVVYTGGSFDKASFFNSIIYGSQTSELLIDSYTGEALNYRFDYCLTRINEDSLDYTLDPLFTNIINDENPLFDSVPVSYALDTLSPAIDAGSDSYAIDFPFDLEGVNRLDDAAPDLGALERVEEY